MPSILGRIKRFSLLHGVQTGSWAHRASYPVSTRGSFPEVKRLGREAYQSPISNAEVKNNGAINPLAQTCCIGIYAHTQHFLFILREELTCVYHTYGRLVVTKIAKRSVEW